MKKPTKQNQQAILRNARETLGMTTEELAAQLGMSLKAVRSWLEPGTSASHRKMPASAKLLLERIIADRPAKKRK